jgi:hypothetical protein
MDSMTKQRREGEANRPTRAKTGQRKLIKPSWTEFVRLADQAVVAIAGADMINRAERRACGCSRRSRRLDTKWPGTDERQLLRQTKPRKVSEGRRRTRLASSRTGENPPYGMNRGGGGNFGMTRGLFATMLERADTKEAIGLNRSRLRSTRPLARAIWAREDARPPVRAACKATQSHTGANVEGRRMKAETAAKTTQSHITATPKPGESQRLACCYGVRIVYAWRTDGVRMVYVATC